MPDLEQTLATMPLQTSTSDNFKKFKPLLCPPVAELQRLSRNVIRCLPLSRLPSTLPVKDKNSKPLLYIAYIQLKYMPTYLDIPCCFEVSDLSLTVLRQFVGEIPKKKYIQSKSAEYQMATLNERRNQ